MHYKTQDNQLHYLDDDSFEYMLPAGAVKISEEEAEALRPKVAPEQIRKAEIVAALADLDQRSIRPARAVSVAVATGATPEAGDVQKLEAYDAQAVALRAELLTLGA